MPTKYRIYWVTMPYPKQKKANVRMTPVQMDKKLPPQPFFFASDIGKLFHLRETDVLKLAVPHLEAIGPTKVISLKGYYQVCYFGKSKINKPIQHAATKMLIEASYEHSIKFYLNLIGGKDKDGKHKGKAKKSK